MIYILNSNTVYIAVVFNDILQMYREIHCTVTTNIDKDMKIDTKQIIK